MPPEAGGPRTGLRAWPEHLPALRTERLLLRAMDGGDLHALFAIYGDPEVMRYASEPAFPEPATVETMLRSVARLLAEGESLEWAVVTHDTAHDTGELIGTCGLHGFDTSAARADVGILLARRAWGRGYAGEALGAVFGWAEGSLGMRQLRADIDPANLRSLALFERLGFLHCEGSFHAKTIGAGEHVSGPP